MSATAARRARRAANRAGLPIVSPEQRQARDRTLIEAAWRRGFGTGLLMGTLAASLAFAVAALIGLGVL